MNSSLKYICGSVSDRLSVQTDGSSEEEDVCAAVECEV